MRGSPTYLAGRLSRRARWTAIGIAVCAGFAVLSFTVVDGLRSSTYAVSEQFRVDSNLVLAPDLAPFDPLAHGLREGTFVLLTQVTLEDGRVIPLAALEARDLSPPAPDEVRPGPAASLPPGVLSIVAPQAATLRVGAPLALDASQPHWSLVAPSTLRAIDPAFAGHGVSFVVTGDLDASQRASLANAGLVVRPVPAVIPFFESGVAEVVRDLALVVLFSGALVAVLSFEFMNIETRERRHEIGIWRALGMKREVVLGILLRQAALLSIIGLAIGVFAAIALVFVAKRITDLDLLDPRPNLFLVAIVAASTLVATLTGAVLPAHRAARGEVREALEAKA